MKGFQTYLNFDGNARDAMTFYSQCLDAALSMQTFADVKAPTAPGAEHRVMHARLEKGAAMLMASDTMPGMSFVPGTNFAINIDCDSLDEIERYFAALGEGGKVTLPLQDTFWNARFGMLTDKFGVHWMFNCELPRK